MYEECIRKYETEEDIRVSLVFNGVRSLQVAKDPSPWRRERQRACIGSLTIGSLTALKLNSTLSRPVSPLIPLTHNGPVAQKHFCHPRRSLPTKAWSMTERNFPPSKLRLLMAWTDGGCQRCARSYWQYKYNDNLSEGLLVVNDTIDLSEGSLVINNTSAKMTAVAYDLLWLVWLMTCMINDLYGLWLV